jgi:hypothetical protein
MTDSGPSWTSQLRGALLTVTWDLDRGADGGQCTDLGPGEAEFGAREQPGGLRCELVELADLGEAEIWPPQRRLGLVQAAQRRVGLVLDDEVVRAPPIVQRTRRGLARAPSCQARLR